MNDEIYDRLSQFMEEYKWYLDEEMTRETSIEDDFGITGDEAAEFLTKFVEQFNVDASGFKFDDYFEAEGFEFLDFFRKKREKKVLTVGDLERAVELGVLE